MRAGWLLLALVGQPFLWAFIMRTVPVLENRIDIPHYLFDPGTNRISRVPRLRDSICERAGLVTMDLVSGALSEQPRESMFDLTADRWLSNPGAGQKQLEKFASQQLALVQKEDTAQWSVWDLHAGKPRLDVPASAGTPIIIDDQTLAICSERSGFSTTIVDVNTGQTVQVLKPLWWVAPSLLFTVLFYIAWSAVWLSYSMARGFPAWLDSAVVGGFPVAALTWLLRSGDGCLDSVCFGEGNLPPAICAIVCSGLFLLIGHAFFGKWRLATQLVICLLMLAMVGWLLCFLLIDPPTCVDSDGVTEIWMSPSGGEAFAAIIYMLPVWFTAIIGGTLFFLLGYRARHITSTAVQPSGCGSRLDGEAVRPKISTHRRVAQWRVVDLLLLMLATAALLKAFWPMMEHEDLPESLSYLVLGLMMMYLTPATLVSVTCPIFALAALTNVRVFFWTASLLVLLITSLLVFQPIAEFAFSVVPLEVALSADPVRFVLGCPSAIFLLLIPFRLRGWRLHG